MFFLSRCSDRLRREKSNPAPGREEMIDVDDVLSSLQRVLSREHSTVSEVNFRDPNLFVAGDIHNDMEAWNMILQDYQISETIFGYFSRRINILDFLRPFKGVFKSAFMAVLLHFIYQSIGISAIAGLSSGPWCCLFSKHLSPIGYKTLQRGRFLVETNKSTTECLGQQSHRSI